MRAVRTLFAILMVGIFLNTSRGHAAACCAGGSGSALVISGDEQSQLTIALSRSAVIGDAPVDGIPIFRNASNKETSYLYQIDGATLLSDRTQIGAALPLVQRKIERPLLNDGAFGVGDARIGGAYELLPEYSYSYWKPKGFTFLQLTLPTGRSIYESNKLSAVDANGMGFYTLNGGMLFLKTLGRWDFMITPALLYYFSRSFQQSDSPVEVGSGWGWSLGLGFGYSPRGGALRVGVRFQPSYNSPRSFEGVESSTKAQRKWDTALELSYLVSDDWSLLSSYNDQTLIGPAQNTSLSRSILLGIQRRWPR